MITQATETSCPPHAYPKAIFEEGVEKIVVVCAKCGKKNCRYKYQYENHYVKKVKEKKEEPPIKVVHIATVTKITDPDIDLKARFSECLVLLKAAFPIMEDGRIKNMVKTFLESRGYREILKAIGDAL